MRSIPRICQKVSPSARGATAAAGLGVGLDLGLSLDDRGTNLQVDARIRSLVVAEAYEFESERRNWGETC